MTARSEPPDPIQPAHARGVGDQPLDTKPDQARASDVTSAAAGQTSSATAEAQALESYGRLHAVIDSYRTSGLEDPDQLQSLKSRIMEVLEQELARGPSIRLVTPLDRRYSMALAAVRAEVRAAVDREPGVHARRVKIIDANPDTMTIDLRVTMTISSRSAISELQDRLRPRITERLRDAVGLRTGTIDLIAEDIYDE